MHSKRTLHALEAYNRPTRHATATRQRRSAEAPPPVAVPDTETHAFTALTRTPAPSYPCTPAPQVHGTCLGMETLSVILSGNYSILSPYAAEDAPAPLMYTDSAAASHLLKSLPPDVVDSLQNRPIAMENHMMGGWAGGVGGWCGKEGGAAGNMYVPVGAGG